MSRVGSDTGGTFTDLVLDDGTIAKVPSTPLDPGEAVRVGLAVLLGDDAVPPAELAHGTTVATNALLERRGARVALVVNEGFADLIEIARQDRPSLYDARVDRPEPLVPRAWRYEVPGRLDARGAELTPVDPTAIPAIDPAVEAVAVALLHSDLDPAHEQAVVAELVGRGLDVTASSALSPELREYERLVTAVINAYVRPACRSYLRGLAGTARSVFAMTSAGGLVPADDAAERPAALLLSGPAGGVLAGAAIAAANGFPDAITFDMGGTSTDVCLVRGGRPEPAAERQVAGFPVRLPALDVHTIGAGGGSIASIDDGGALQVGPRSAGARPGPACYGHGGTQPTVTDANLVAGHIPADAIFAGIGRLDLGAARDALAAAGVDAAGVLAVVDTSMEEALRAVSVEQGVDPRGLALVAFGGAGPLHACALADALAMPAVVVPPRAGVFSAVGILGAPLQVDLVLSWPTPLDHTGLDAARVRLADEARARLASMGSGETDVPRHPSDREGGEGGGSDADRTGRGAAVAGAAGSIGAGDVEPRPQVASVSGVEPLSRVDADGGVRSAVEVETTLDCRYAGQSHALRVAAIADFDTAHARHNGYERPGTGIEVVAVRATARRPAAIDPATLPAPVRSSAEGPAVIAEADCTIWVPAGWRADPGVAGALVLRRTS